MMGEYLLQLHYHHITSTHLHNLTHNYHHLRRAPSFKRVTNGVGASSSKSIAERNQNRRQSTFLVDSTSSKHILMASLYSIDDVLDNPVGM